MTAQKQGQPAAGASAGESGGKRKTWVKKTPTELILQQVARQEQRVNALRKELATAEGELKKMQDATRLLQTK